MKIEKRIIHGHIIWTKDRYLHRDDGPAFIRRDGTESYYKDGLLHRDIGPAVMRPDATNEWWENGQLHREYGPAIHNRRTDKHKWFFRDVYVMTTSGTVTVVQCKEFRTLVKEKKFDIDTSNDWMLLLMDYDEFAHRLNEDNGPELFKPDSDDYYIRFNRRPITQTLLGSWIVKIDKRLGAKTHLKNFDEFLGKEITIKSTLKKLKLVK